MKRKLIKALIACMIVSAVIGGGYYGYNKFLAAKPASTSAQYFSATAKRMNLKVNVQGEGAAYAAVTKDVTPYNNGVLENLNLKVGDTVKAGDTLFTSNSDAISKNISSAQDNLNKNEIGLTGDESNYTNEITNATAAVTEAQNKLNAALIQVEDMTVKAPIDGVIASVDKSAGPVKKGEQILSIQDSKSNIIRIVAPNDGNLKNLTVKVGDAIKAGNELFVADSQTIRQNAAMAQSSLDRANTALTNAKNDNKAAMDQLNIESTQSQLDYAVEQSQKMTVTAPIGGIITAINNNNGDNVQTQNPVLTIVDTSSMKVKVSVDELDISKVKVGQKTEVTFDAIQNKVYDGTVESIAFNGTTSGGVTTYDVVIDLPNHDGVQVGMNANVNIEIDSKDNALAIPVEAIIDMNGNKYVWVESDGSSNSSSNPYGSYSQGNGSQSWQNQSGSSQSGSSGQSGRSGQSGGNSQSGRTNGSTSTNASSSAPKNGRLVRITIGLENQDYAEVLSGLSEGEKIFIVLPQVTNGTTTSNRSGMSGLGGIGGGMSGGYGGGYSGGSGGRSQSSSGK